MTFIIQKITKDSIGIAGTILILVNEMARNKASWHPLQTRR